MLCGLAPSIRSKRGADSRNRATQRTNRIRFANRGDGFHSSRTVASDNAAPSGRIWVTQDGFSLLAGIEVQGYLQSAEAGGLVYLSTSVDANRPGASQRRVDVNMRFASASIGSLDRSMVCPFD